jgi:hypothetical protein
MTGLRDCGSLANALQVDQIDFAFPAARLALAVALILYQLVVIGTAGKEDSFDCEVSVGNSPEHAIIVRLLYLVLPFSRPRG